MKEVNGIPVHCAFNELADITSLVPNPRNPNTHPEKQVQLLAKIIKNQGWRAPITVSNRSGFIVRGHGRLLAAQFLGVEQVPVDRQDYATEAEEWADLIADNRIAELAEMDDALLKGSPCRVGRQRVLTTKPGPQPNRERHWHSWARRLFHLPKRFTRS